MVPLMAGMTSEGEPAEAAWMGLARAMAAKTARIVGIFMAGGCVGARVIGCEVRTKVDSESGGEG